MYLKKIKKNTWRYHYFTPVYQKSWSYDLQFLRYRVWQTEIGNYGSFFAFLTLPSPPPLHPSTTKNTKNQNFEKWKKLLKISFYTCVPNMSWYMEWDKHNFLSFGAIFLPFYTLTTQKNKILKKWKNHLEILSFYTHVS